MNKNMSEESHKKIFISHSSKDKQIVDIFLRQLRLVNQCSKLTTNTN